MSWPELVRQGFPDPHDREPANLRGDIADELADHLACAMARELRRSDDESVARRAVLERFGDPWKVARRLWFDAMKETIMKDRIMLVVVVVLALTALASTAFAWLSFQRSEQTAHAVLAKLEAISSRPPATSIPLEAAYLTVRLVQGSKDATPVPDVEISLYGSAFREKEEKVASTTDDSGKVSLGPIRPGYYKLRLFSKELRLSGEGSISLFGSQTQERQIVLPDLPPLSNVSFIISYPDDRLPQEFLLACTFQSDGPLAANDGVTWRLLSGPSVTLTPRGRIIATPPDRVRQLRLPDARGGVFSVQSYEAEDGGLAVTSK